MGQAGSSSWNRFYGRLLGNPDGRLVISTSAQPHMRTASAQETGQLKIVHTEKKKTQKLLAVESSALGNVQKFTQINYGVIAGVSVCMGYVYEGLAVLVESSVFTA